MSQIGERIKIARTMAGLSLRQLADGIGVTAQAISKYETGKVTPGTDVLLRIARVAGLKVDFFLRDHSFESGPPEFRKRSGLPAKEQKRILGRVRDWIERYHDAELLCNEQPCELPNYISEQTIASPEDCELCAQDLRQQWDLGTDPVLSMTGLMEDHGIKIMAIDADGGFDALAIRIGSTFAAVLREGAPPDRKRFSLAHELGHMVCPFDSSTPIKFREDCANRFAGAFLVPGECVRKELGPRRSWIKPEELHLLKHKYGLSMNAWLYRAKDIGVLSADDYQKHAMYFSARGWKKQEPFEQLASEEVPQRFDRLVFRLYSEDAVSESKLSELVGKPFSDFLNQFESQHCGQQAVGSRGRHQRLDRPSSRGDHSMPSGSG